jgi:hypothetical protein
MWQEFTRSHLALLQATDFFTSDVWRWLGLLVSCLRRMIPFGRHQIPSVRVPRPQPVQTIHALMRCLHDLRLQGRRWAHLIHEQSRAIRGGETFWSSQGLRLRLLIRPCFALKTGARSCLCRPLALDPYAMVPCDANPGVTGNSTVTAAWPHDEGDRVWRSERLEGIRCFRETAC